MGNNLSAEFTISDPIDIPVATIFSESQREDVNVDFHKKLCKRVSEKRKKFQTTNLLLLQNATSNIIYTVFGGIYPQKELKLDEIDILKILGHNNSRENFVKLLENPKNIKNRAVPKLQTTYQNFLQKIDEYIAFFEDKFDGLCLQNVKKLRTQFRSLKDQFPERINRVHAEDIGNHLKKVINLKLDLCGPLDCLLDLFHPGLLLFYAMENNVAIAGLNFSAFKRQNPLNFCSYNDMGLACETLLAWFSNGTERADKKLIVSSIIPGEYPTRLSNSQFFRYTYVPNFIKIAFHETAP
jgi:hypothetical protein